jgi:hypothetical protein
LKALLNTLNQHLNLEHLERSLSQSSDVQLVKCHEDWRLFLNLCRRFATLSSEREILEKIITRLAVGLGHIAILVVLALRQTGQEKLIDDLILQAVDFEQRLTNDQQLIAGVQRAVSRA